MEASNNAKLRDLAKAVAHMNDDGYWNSSASICALVDKAKNALAEPVRNCDVGTAEEQYKRFMNMCNSKDVRQCAECGMRGFTPGCSRDRCFANWAQMPYVEKEGGDDAD